MFLFIYNLLFRALTPVIRKYLRFRLRQGKEHPIRLKERFGIPSFDRPQGKLLWINAVSVGEAQAALILAESFKAKFPLLSILVTTVTVTSAELMAKRLPEIGALHQFAPVDHPSWVRRFLDHWQPDACLWMESELWPSVLTQIKERKIPCALMNAHMSEKSFRGWSIFSSLAKTLLNTFDIAFAQTNQDRDYYKFLGLENISTVDNLKYASKPLPYKAQDLSQLEEAIQNRPLWVYASTHAGEEELAARLHRRLKMKIPNILTVIIPRHPNRRDSILASLAREALQISLRGEGKNQPSHHDDLYIADTMGELGLFYKLAPIACIGRSFSNDGGGGHNPIEAAQYGCAVLYGPNVQNLQGIFDEFKAAHAAIQVHSEDEFYETVLTLLQSPEQLKDAQLKALSYVQNKGRVLESIMNDLDPIFKGLSA